MAGSMRIWWRSARSLLFSEFHRPIGAIRDPGPCNLIVIRVARPDRATLQEPRSGVEGVSFPCSGWQDAVVQERHRRLRAVAAMLLDLAHDVEQRAALDDEPIDPHPGRGPVHAAVAVD